LIEFPLVTERLLLRPLEAADEEELHETLAHPTTLAAIGHDGPWTRAATRSSIERRGAHQRRYGFAMWGMAERESGALVGICGLQMLEGGPEVEVGWHVHPAVRGRGYAPEAGRAALDAGFGTLGLQRVVAVTDPGNASSRRVMEKLGMTLVGPGRHYGGVTVVYELTGGSG
jgi:RimJ/RimL family protein N-acetyltransferase